MGRLSSITNRSTKIAFTGSTEVGKGIQRAIAKTSKRLTLELGGKAANIVFEDAAIDQAVEGIVNGIYFNQGHVCCAGSRLFVQESIKDEVIRKLKHRMNTLVIGDPLDKNTDVGAINSAEQLETIEKYIEIGKQEGAEFLSTRILRSRQWLLVSAKSLHQRGSVQPNRSGGNFWSGVGGTNVSNGCRGDQKG